MNFIITSDTSFSNEVLPFLLKNLDISGWALIQIKEYEENLEYRMLALSVLVGQFLGSNVGYHFLHSNGSDERLSAHSEGISNPDGIIPYFSLCCITSSETGGETRLFDGRIAAQKVNNQPRLNGVKIGLSVFI